MKLVARISEYELVKHGKGYNVRTRVGTCFGRPVTLKTALKRVDMFVTQDLEQCEQAQLAYQLVNGLGIGES